MDEATIESRGLTPIQPDLDRIAKVTTKADLPALVVQLQGEGVRSLFGFTSQVDFKDATQVVPVLRSGGIGLPDRDYYLKADPKSVEQRKLYLVHVQKMLALLGGDPAQAEAGAAAVMEIETALARASLDNVSRRDPNRIYHKMGRQELAALGAGFDWERFFTAVGAPSFAVLNVSEPDFVKAANQLIASTDLEKLKAYMRWHLVDAYADFLPRAFVEENFAFTGRILAGAKELQPRWKRCVNSTDRDLGEALGQVYVEQAFSQDAKERTQAMVRSIEKALEADITTLPWMTEATKQQALVKLRSIGNKIGYPDLWRDYSRLEIMRGDALGNRQRARAFEVRRQLAKIGKPIDRGEWGMTPPTVNASYNPSKNEITLPAGILRTPAFDNSRDDAANYGAIGSVIGHELSHGFDDQGRRFDAAGNLRDWWTPADGAEFEKRASCVADEYGGFTAIGDLKLNGRLTLGENVADNGGVRIAFMALESSLGGKPGEKLDGYTPEQRFFIGMAQLFCDQRTPEAARLSALTDPHSPGRYRINGVFANMPEFQKAWSCQPGAPMVRDKVCRVW
ncbi:MAG: M13 family metallopeptidase, partial [Acidobacteriota bacterium]|nr:M13 family metallopeptidase [Acidobacteriota bacterium]